MSRTRASLSIALILAMLLSASVGAVADEKPKSATTSTRAGGLRASRSLVPDPAERPGAYRPGEVIVKFREGAVSSAGKRAVHVKAGALESRRLGAVPGLEKVRLKDGVTVDAAIATYEAQPGVEYAEPDYVYSIDVLPDDTYIDDLWGLHNTGQTGGTPDADIDAGEAWDLETGDAGVVVAVIDTGVDYLHPDLDDNVWTNAAEAGGTGGVDDDGNGYVDDVHGYDFVNTDADPMDDNDHGTHVSGTIGAEGDNALAVSGVNWDVRIMPLKAFDSLGYGDVVAEIDAVAYADAMGADVINCSWGGGSYSQALRDAMDAADALVVCAAGNGGSDGIGDDNDATPYYPASYEVDNIVAVAATDDDDVLASFSNYGAASVDLAAPGVNVLSTLTRAYASSGAVFEDSFDDATLDPWDASSYVTAPWVADTAHYSSAPAAASHMSPANNENASMVAGPFDLSAANAAVLWAYYDWNLEKGYDYLHVEVSTDGLDWDRYASVTGVSSGRKYADLTDWAGSPQVWIRYRIQTDSSVQSLGVMIDDVELLAGPPFAEEDLVGRMSGTSMATPHVSGAAALLKAYEPTLTPLEVRARILDNVDLLGSLSGKTVTGGRLNAFRALEPSGTPETDAVYGVVTNASGGAPVGYAWVDLYRYNPAIDGYYWEAWTKTDGIGGYGFDTVVPGDHVLGVDAYGFEYWEQGFTYSLEPVRIDAALTARDIDISGTVTDAASGAYVYTYVDLWKYDAARGDFYWEDYDWTDGLGRYDFGGLTTGQYVLTVEAEWYEPWVSSVITFSGSQQVRNAALTRTKVRRLADQTRYSTAVEISREVFDPVGDGSWPGVTHVILASGEDRAAADPLAASALSWAYDAPLFLVSSTAVADEVERAVREIKAAAGTAVTVHVVGGTTSVPDARFFELDSAVGGGLVKDRILKTGGRYDLAAAIAARVDVAWDTKYGPGSKPDAVLVANGADPAKFFDALALSPISAAKGYPILLVTATSVPVATSSAINGIHPTTVVVGGGPNTVSNAVVNQLGALRWYGATRYTTAIAIANNAISRGWLDDTLAGVAARLPDAFAGGSAAGKEGGPLLLTSGTSLTSETGDWLRAHKAGLGRVYVFGGPVSVSDGVVSAIEGKVD